MTADVREPLRKLILVKDDWSWNGMYQDLHDKAEKVITENACMKFYDA